MRIGELVAAGAAAVMAVGITTVLIDLPRDGTQEESPQRVVVTNVLDGDTLQVSSTAGADLSRVRLLGIDAPEVAHRQNPGDCYGDVATRALQRLTPAGSTIQLLSDKGQPDRDKYGRILRYVEDLSGRDAGMELLEEGAARLYDSARGLEREQDYQDAGAAAQKNAHGLWSHC